MSDSDLVAWNGCTFLGHPSAFIDSPSLIGEGTKIWHYAHVCKGARIGKNCMIGQGVHIGPNVVIGDGCRIQNGAQIFEGVILEDEVFVGPCAVFTNVLRPRVGVKRPVVRTVVEHGASIGANATILCGYTIGTYALVGAAAVVTRDVEAHAIVVGSPLFQVGYACTCGGTITAPAYGQRCESCDAPYHWKSCTLVRGV